MCGIRIEWNCHYGGSKDRCCNPIKREGKSVLLFCHCVTHHTNLAALDTTKKRPCIEISKEVDKMINRGASFF